MEKEKLISIIDHFCWFLNLIFDHFGRPKKTQFRSVSNLSSHHYVLTFCFFSFSFFFRLSFRRLVECDALCALSNNSLTSLKDDSDFRCLSALGLSFGRWTFTREPDRATLSESRRVSERKSIGRWSISTKRTRHIHNDGRQNELESCFHSNKYSQSPFLFAPFDLLHLVRPQNNCASNAVHAWTMRAFVLMHR